jgi:hypothetical protein
MDQQLIEDPDLKEKYNLPVRCVSKQETHQLHHHLDAMHYPCKGFLFLLAGCLKIRILSPIWMLCMQDHCFNPAWQYSQLTCCSELFASNTLQLHSIR